MAVRRWFYDLEMIERADSRAIDLVSVGMVAEDGEEYYAVCSDHDPAQALPWVRKNVLAQLPSPSDPAWRTRDRIRADLEALLLVPGETPELWAWYAAYDHVVFCQLWGRMPDLPRQLPRFTRDLRQLWEELGSPKLPEQPGGKHDALADARHNVTRWRVMNDRRAWLGR